MNTISQIINKPLLILLTHCILRTKRKTLCLGINFDSYILGALYRHENKPHPFRQRKKKLCPLYTRNIAHDQFDCDPLP